jgi:hypothetical protein
MIRRSLGLRSAQSFASGGGSCLPFTGIADPHQLAMLVEVLDDHCREHAIVDPLERDGVARRLFLFFSFGSTTADQLRLDLSSAGVNLDDRCS